MRIKRVAISEVLLFQEGPGVRNNQYTTEGVKLLNVANLVDGKIDLSTSNRYISEEEAYGRYSHFLCEEGDLIVASSGIKVDYIDKKMGFIEKSMLPLCMNTSTIRFKVIDENVLRIRYFMYYLKSNDFKSQLYRHITGSAQLNYGPSHLKKMDLPIVDIVYQDKIINKLDSIQSLIELNYKKLHLLDELVKSQFVEMFEFNCAEFNSKKLTNYAKVFGGFAFKSNLFSTNEIPIIRISNIVDGIVSPDYNICSTKSFWEENNKFRVEQMDILMAMSGATTGKTGIYKESAPALLNQRVACIRALENKSCPEFLFVSTQMEKMQENIKKLSTGSAQPNISNKQIENLLVPEATYERQLKFKSFYNQVDKSKFNLLMFHFFNQKLLFIF